MLPNRDHKRDSKLTKKLRNYGNIPTKKAGADWPPLLLRTAFPYLVKLNSKLLTAPSAFVVVALSLNGDLADDF